MAHLHLVQSRTKLDCKNIVMDGELIGWVYPMNPRPMEAKYGQVYMAEVMTGAKDHTFLQAPSEDEALRKVEMLVDLPY